MSRSFVTKAYKRLLEHFGPQYWWPGETSFEVMIGAILTQNTNWQNVEKAIGHLKAASLLSVAAIDKASEREIASLIRPAGYYNLKTKRLKSFINFVIKEFKGNVKVMREAPLSLIRSKLLRVNGIGPETADSICLYALDKPTFVVDAYTKRMLYRHNVVSLTSRYEDMKALFEKFLDKDTRLFNEYHALIVRLGKDYCRPFARCERCPLNKLHYSLNERCPACYRGLTLKQKEAKSLSATKNPKNGTKQNCPVCEEK